MIPLPPRGPGARDLERLRLYNDSGSSFCNVGRFARITQELRDVSLVSFIQGVGSYFERDGSISYEFEHDAYPGHETYTWAYTVKDFVLGEPYRYSTPGAEYFYAPQSNFLIVCLAPISLPVVTCPQLTHRVFVP